MGRSREMMFAMEEPESRRHFYLAKYIYTALEGNYVRRRFRLPKNGARNEINQLIEGDQCLPCPDLVLSKGRRISSRLLPWKMGISIQQRDERNIDQINQFDVFGTTNGGGSCLGCFEAG